MRREWSPEELIESWSLVGQDWTLVGNPHPAGAQRRPPRRQAWFQAPSKLVHDGDSAY
jgi:hypothetical protein